MSEQWSELIPFDGTACPIPWAKVGEYRVVAKGETLEYRSTKDACDINWKAARAYRYRLDLAPKD